MKKAIGLILGISFWALIWLPLHIIFGAFDGAVDAFKDLKTAIWE